MPLSSSYVATPSTLSQAHAYYRQGRDTNKTLSRHQQPKPSSCLMPRMSWHQSLGVATLKSNGCKGNFVSKLNSSHIILFKVIFVNVRIENLIYLMNVYATRKWRIFYHLFVNIFCSLTIFSFQGFSFPSLVVISWHFLLCFHCSFSFLSDRYNNLHRYFGFSFKAFNRFTSC